MTKSRLTLAVASAIGLATIVAAPAAANDHAALLANEVPLQVVGIGKSSVAADRATLTMNISQSGATNAEARAKVQAQGDVLIAELVKRGVPRRSISVDEGVSRMGFVGNEAYPEFQEALAQAGGAPKKIERKAALSIKIVLDDLALLPRVRQFLDERNAIIAESPALDLRDDRQARHAAMRDAVQNARAEAEVYADAVGMRLVRVIRISDPAGESALGAEYADLMRKMMALKGTTEAGKVETIVRVNVEYALAPK